MKTKQKGKLFLEIAQHKNSLLTMTILERHYARSTAQRFASSPNEKGETFARGLVQHWDDFRGVWSLNSIAKSSGKFHLSYTGRTQNNNTARKHRNRAQSKAKTLRSGSDETHVGIFSSFPTDSNRFEMNVWLFGERVVAKENLQLQFCGVFRGCRSLFLSALTRVDWFLKLRTNFKVNFNHRKVNWASTNWMKTRRS